MAATPPLPVNGPVEKKVTWSAVGTYVVGVVLLGLSDLLGAHPEVVSGMPEWLNAILMPLVPAIGAFASGYLAHHTPRPDLEAAPQTPPPAPGSQAPYGP